MSSSIGEMIRRLSQESYKNLGCPWVIKVTDQISGEPREYAVGTNGKALVFALDWRPVLILNLAEDRKEAREKVMALFFPPTELQVAWSGRLADLKNACGEAVWALPCEACKGLSASSEYVSCSFCDNDGVMCPDIRPGYVCEVGLDLGLLARVLEPFDGADCVQLVPEKASGPKKEGKLWIISNRFRVLVLGLAIWDVDSDLAEKWKTALKFPAEGVA